MNPWASSRTADAVEAWLGLAHLAVVPMHRLVLRPMSQQLGHGAH